MNWLNLLLRSSAVLGLMASILVRAGDTELLIRDGALWLNGEETKILGLRCSNALMSEKSTRELIEALDLYRSYGVNTISVFIMGSRFGDVKGFLPDSSLSPLYSGRLRRILAAVEERGMVAIVGCLYWSTSKAKEDLSHWRQSDANRAVANAARWLAEGDFRNVILDPDNEGMACRANDWLVEPMISAAKEANPDLLVANNTKQSPTNEDLNMHFGEPEEGKPWFDSEATPENAPNGYWGNYSKETHQQLEGFYNYSRIGRYTIEMKEEQKRRTMDEVRRYNGFILASTWLQCGPANGVGGPFARPGGRSELGSVENELAPWNVEIDTLHPDAGILWWLEFVRENF